MKLFKFAALAAGVAFSVAVPSVGLAQSALGGPDSAWYAGASVGQSRAKNTCSLFFGTTCDSTDTSYRVFGGYQVNKNLALELCYQQLGDVSLTSLGVTGTIETKAYDLSVLGILPVANRVSVYGRLGVYYADVDFSVPGTSASGSGTDLVYGIGAQYDFANGLGIRAEWQKYNNAPLPSTLFIPLGTSYEVMSVGAIWRFK